MFVIHYVRQCMGHSLKEPIEYALCSSSSRYANLYKRKRQKGVPKSNTGCFLLNCIKHGTLKTNMLCYLNTNHISHNMPHALLMLGLTQLLLKATNRQIFAQHPSSICKVSLLDQTSYLSQVILVSIVCVNNTFVLFSAKNIS